MKRLKYIFIIALFFYSFFFLSGKILAKESYIFDFKDENSLAGWEVKNIEDFRVSENRLIIKSKAQGLLISPNNLNLSAVRSQLQIKLNLEEADNIHFIWQGTNINYNPPPSISFRAEKGINIYFIDLKKSKYWEDNISQIGFLFEKGNQNIELFSIEFIKPSFAETLKLFWQEFSYPELLKPSSINLLYGPTLFYLPFLSYIYILFFIFLCVKVFNYFKKSANLPPKETKHFKQALIHSLFIFMILGWIAYDIRDTYNQIKIADAVYSDYLLPAPENKRFFDLYDFYAFTDFAKKNIPLSGKVSFFPYTPWPFGTRAIYFLFPVRVFENKEDLSDIDYLITYKNKNVIFENGNLMLLKDNEKKVLGKNWKVLASFDENSIIYQKIQ